MFYYNTLTTVYTCIYRVSWGGMCQTLSKSLRPKYSPQHFTLEHPQQVFLLRCERPIFIPIQNKRQNYSS